MTKNSGFLDPLYNIFWSMCDSFSKGVHILVCQAQKDETYTQENGEQRHYFFQHFFEWLDRYSHVS